MEKIYYVTEAFISSYEQGTDLMLIKTSAGEVYGGSAEFELCTKDILLVSGPYDAQNKSYSRAVWWNIAKKSAPHLQVGKIQINLGFLRL